MKKKILFLIIVLGFLNKDLVAQTHEFGVTVGFMNYIGDLAPSINSETFNPTFGAFYKYNHDVFFISRFSLNYGSVEGADRPYAFNRLRNLSFKSNIWEMSYMTEFNFQAHGFDKFTHPFTPYVVAGLSGFYFNPKAVYDRVTYDLRDYGTEGQFLRHSGTYTRFDWAIPFGMGFKLHLTKNFILAAEGIWRRTATDHLDDVGNGNYMQDARGKYVYTGYPGVWDMQKFNGVDTSSRDLAIRLSDRSHQVTSDGTNLSFRGKQRGNPYNKDWYFTFGITLSYKIVKYSCNKGGF